MTCKVWTTFSLEGFHSYDSAPVGVGFLKNNHRHLFHVRVEIEVYHNNRDIEFILLNQALKKRFPDNSLNEMSCEMMCENIADFIHSKYANWRGRNIVVSVSEDNESGSILETIV